MTRFMTISCPKCGSVYIKQGKCTECGYIIDTEKGQQFNASAPRDTLMQCPDCGRMISKNALSCPQCGCPFPGNYPQTKSQEQSPAKSSGGTGILGTIIAIVIAGLVLWYIAAPYSTPVWLQHIGGTIKAFFSGETSYKIFDPSKLPR